MIDGYFFASLYTQNKLVKCRRNSTIKWNFFAKQLKKINPKSSIRWKSQKPFFPLRHKTHKLKIFFSLLTSFHLEIEQRSFRSRASTFFCYNFNWIHLIPRKTSLLQKLPATHSLFSFSVIFFVRWSENEKFNFTKPKKLNDKVEVN